MKQDKCPLCQSEPSKATQDEAGVLHVECPACGHFTMDADLREQVWTHRRRYLLSALTRQAHDRKQTFHVGKNEVQTLDTARSPTPIDIMDRILLHIDSREEPAGTEVSFGLDDYPLFTCASWDELAFCLGTAVELDYLWSDSSLQSKRCGLAVAGWKRLAELRVARPRSTGQAFVAHWFAAQINQAYKDGFAPALEDAGWTPRNLGFEHNQDIADLALAEIRQSSLVIADCTENRPSVLFEAGFAFGLGIPVIFTCSEESRERNGLPFDTSHFNHVLWTDVQDLRTQLTNRVKALYPGPKLRTS